MQTIISYFQDFFQQTNKPFLIFCTAFAALLVIANYKLGIESKWLAELGPRPLKFAGFYLLYLLAFTMPYLFYFITVRSAVVTPFIAALIVIAPAIFALKVTAGGWQEIIRNVIPGENGRYWAIISNWPIRFLLTGSLLFLFNLLLKKQGQPALADLGLTTENFKWWPYIVLLIGIIPLVGFAASQPSFLHAYPKLKALQFLAPGGPTTFRKIVFELSYASDFLTIELFFRGFLVVAFTRYLGPAAILPMAVFYCSIHFGKPLLECISSYFGGILLGVIACYSQSILGGIVVHIGLAWMMELAAMLAANRFLKA
jgi:hypothetical protein